MRTTEYDAEELERQIGPRGSTPVKSSGDGANRHLIQNWLVARGIPATVAKGMRLKSLGKAYNIESYFQSVKEDKYGYWKNGDHSDSGNDESPDEASSPVPEANEHGAPIPDAPVSPVTKPLPVGDDPASQLADLLGQLARKGVDRAEVERIVDERVNRILTETQRIIPIRVQHENGNSVDVGIQHYLFPELLACCNARNKDGHRLNVWLVGPAAAGKTYAAEMVAKALNLEFSADGVTDNAYKLMGYMDANGRYVRTAFRNRFEYGGAYLADEVDSWQAGATIALNSATSNGLCQFPDCMVRRHPDFVMIGAANTWGLGGNSDYVARIKQDASSLDRFAFLEWDYDLALERQLSGNLDWCAYVQACRKRAHARGLKVLITPRATFMGAALLAAGMPLERVKAMTIRKGMSAEQWEMVRA